MRLLRVCTAFGLLVATVVLAAGRTVVAAPPIQPGASMTVSDGDSTSWCTLNWIYDGVGARTGKVYAGTAAHCVSKVGQRVSLSTMSLGEPILSFGRVAFVAPTLDYAFIEVDAAKRKLVRASLLGHPEVPTGVSTRRTAAVGDQMRFSGHGVGFDLTAYTQQQRMGVLAYNDGTRQYVYGPVTQGDSGGPVANASDGDKAFGIVNTLSAGLTPLPFVGEGGLALEGVLADAARRGFAVKLRVVR